MGFFPFHFSPVVALSFLALPRPNTRLRLGSYGDASVGVCVAASLTSSLAGFTSFSEASVEDPASAVVLLTVDGVTSPGWRSLPVEAWMRRRMRSKEALPR